MDMRLRSPAYFLREKLNRDVFYYLDRPKYAEGAPKFYDIYVGRKGKMKKFQANRPQFYSGSGPLSLWFAEEANPSPLAWIILPDSREIYSADVSREPSFAKDNNKVALEYLDINDVQKMLGEIPGQVTDYKPASTPCELFKK